MQIRILSSAWRMAWKNTVTYLFYTFFFFPRKKKPPVCEEPPRIGSQAALQNGIASLFSL